MSTKIDFNDKYNDWTTLESATIENKKLEVRFTLDAKSEDGTFEPIAPLHGTPTAAGFDLYAAREMTILPRGSQLISTGVRMEIPEGWFGMICPRSSVASKTPLRIGARVIDSDYRGEVLVNLHNDSNISAWKVEKGERVAQIVFMQHLTEMVQVETLESSVRGDGGFGSTGK